MNRWMDDETCFRRISGLEDSGSSGKVSLGLVFGTFLCQGMILRKNKGLASRFNHMMGGLVFIIHDQRMIIVVADLSAGHSQGGVRMNQCLYRRQICVIQASSTGLYRAGETKFLNNQTRINKCNMQQRLVQQALVCVAQESAELAENSCAAARYFLYSVTICLLLFYKCAEDIFNNCLRQGCEVCSIMEDVYLTRKRNVNGGVLI
jgi:hypothetical protein